MTDHAIVAAEGMATTNCLLLQQSGGWNGNSIFLTQGGRHKEQYFETNLQGQTFKQDPWIFGPYTCL